MKIVIAPDKFKGSMTAAEAAWALGNGFQKVWPEAKIAYAPIADGGEGTARALCEALGGEWVTVEVRGPLGHSVNAGYAFVASPKVGARVKTAIIEMSEASGLALVPPPERRATEATTYGTGELILDAIRRGAERIIVGIGGSATTDGGVGMAEALGYRFYSRSGDQLVGVAPHRFHEIERIDIEEVIPLPELVAACDVQNPLLGERGSARLFSPQKGASPEEVVFLESALSHLSQRVSEHLGGAHHEVPGAGAAGGLGFGLLVFGKATIRPGFDLVAEVLDLEKQIAEADLVITGEGSLDAQTLEGKGPAGVAEIARKYQKPVIAFGGRVVDGAEQCFDVAVPLADRPLSLDEAIQRGAELAERAAVRAATLLKLGQALKVQ